MDSLMDVETSDNILAWRAGAKSVFSSWSLIELALEGQFGGQHSQTICQDIYYDLMDLFDKEGNKIDQDMIADFLYQCLDTDLHVDVEDDSVEKIASVFLKLYQECTAGKFELLQALLAKNAKLRPLDKLFDGKKLTVWPPPPEEVVPSPPAKSQPKHPTPQPDEDGWVTIPTKKKQSKPTN